jgi:hypothetical protein
MAKNKSKRSRPKNQAPKRRKASFAPPVSYKTKKTQAYHALLRKQAKELERFRAQQYKQFVKTGLYTPRKKSTKLTKYRRKRTAQIARKTGGMANPDVTFFVNLKHYSKAERGRILAKADAAGLNVTNKGFFVPRGRGKRKADEVKLYINRRKGTYTLKVLTKKKKGVEREERIMPITPYTDVEVHMEDIFNRFAKEHPLKKNQSYRFRIGEKNIGTDVGLSHRSFKSMDKLRAYLREYAKIGIRMASLLTEVSMVIVSSTPKHPYSFSHVDGEWSHIGKEWDKVDVGGYNANNFAEKRQRKTKRQRVRMK